MKVNKQKPLKCYVLLVSRYFGKESKQAGEPTNFVEKILDGSKKHTIRLNYQHWEKRFEEIKAGKAYLSLRYWLGAPYKSPQEEFLKLTAADGIGLQKVSFPMGVFIDDCDSNVKLKTLAENDGLDFETFKEWFGDKLTANNDNEDLAIIHFTNFRYTNSKSEND